ncbi:hypothetical protein GHK29_11795 [Sinorhizobium medicae]|nr:hypothetical protein [Sinorhizobium medicae]
MRSACSQMFSKPKESIRLFAGLCVNGLMARASSKKSRDVAPLDPMQARVDRERDEHPTAFVC